MRQHGAKKGTQFFVPLEPSKGWRNSQLGIGFVPTEFDIANAVYVAPLGTIAAVTTPVPEGRCECGKLAGHEGLTFLGGRHMDACPAHPRNAYVHILPHLLAQLPEKPEGLMWVTAGSKSWTLGPAQMQFPWMKEDWDIYGGGDFAYAVPPHVLDRIEQQLSTKGGAK